MEGKKNTSRPEFPCRILKNGVEIELNNEYPFDNEPYKCVMVYPKEFKDTIANLDDEKLKQMAITKAKANKGIVQEGIGYTYGLADSFVDHAIVIRNPAKIPLFEYTMYHLLKYILDHYKLMPTCLLNDFFKEEMKGQPEAFGKVGYFIDLTREDMVHFYTKGTEQATHITVEQVKKLMEEIREYIGKNEHYDHFDKFIARLGSFTTIEEIANDPFYTMCQKRCIVPIIDAKEVTEQKQLSEGGFGSIEAAKLGEKEICIKKLSRHYEPYFALALKREMNYQQTLYDQPSVIETCGQIPSEKEGYPSHIVLKREKMDLRRLIEQTIKETSQSLFEKDPKQTMIMLCDIISVALAVKQSDILYRDYKINDVLITEDSRCVICDFGAATFLSNDNMGDTKVMCQFYIPESFISAIDISMNDIYAIGMTLIQLFTNQTVEVCYGMDSKEFVGMTESAKCSHMMQKLFSETKERLGQDPMMMPYVLYIGMIEPVLFGFLEQEEDKRKRFDSLEWMKLFTILYLLEGYQYVYKPLVKHTLPEITVMDVIKEGMTWYEQEVLKAFQSSLFDEYKTIYDGENRFTGTLYPLISSYGHLLMAIGKNCAETKNLKLLVGSIERLQLLCSFGYLKPAEMVEIRETVETLIQRKKELQ